MALWRCTVNTSATLHILIEADSREDAEQEARQAFEDDPSSFEILSDDIISIDAEEDEGDDEDEGEGEGEDIVDKEKKDEDIPH